MSDKPDDVAKAKVFKSPGGVSYPLWADDKNDDFVAGSLRNNLDGVTLPTSLPITKWNNLSYVGLFGHFLIVGEPNCHISLSFSRPTSVERR